MPEMQEWTTQEHVMKSRVEQLTQEIVQVYREAYYALHRSEVDQVVATRAREETATRLATVEASLATQQAAREEERATLIAEKAAVVSQLRNAKRVKCEGGEASKHSQHDEESIGNSDAGQSEFERLDTIGTRVASTAEQTMSTEDVYHTSPPKDAPVFFLVCFEP